MQLEEVVVTVSAASICSSRSNERFDGSVVMLSRRSSPVGIAGYAVSFVALKDVPCGTKLPVNANLSIGVKYFVSSVSTATSSIDSRFSNVNAVLDCTAVLATAVSVMSSPFRTSSRVNVHAKPVHRLSDGSAGYTSKLQRSNFFQSFVDSLPR